MKNICKLGLFWPQQIIWISSLIPLRLLLLLSNTDWNVSTERQVKLNVTRMAIVWSQNVDGQTQPPSEMAALFKNRNFFIWQHGFIFIWKQLKFELLVYDNYVLNIYIPLFLYEIENFDDLYRVCKLVFIFTKYIYKSMNHLAKINHTWFGLSF